VTTRVPYSQNFWGIFNSFSFLIKSQNSSGLKDYKYKGTYKKNILLIAIFAFPFLVSAQDGQLFHQGNNSNVQKTQAIETSSLPSDSLKRYIIKLVEPSGATLKTDFAGRATRIQSVQEQHKKFYTDLNQTKINSASGRVAEPAKILYEYLNVYNGFSIRASQSTIETLKGLDYVLDIIEDKMIFADDLESSKIIGADKVWAELGVTGKNISIAIIDTGIDYNHQDLGGGLGEKFKVKGGYDFVNNDTDPLDDNGHGTHVAGIAAANGPGLKGVAPDANLYAYKVLSKEGSGYDSWVMAGIERVVDPDQNPATDDKHDVANMSLGRPIGDSDPVSEAVNNAVLQGVTFVVSGGNSSDYGTIGTPAISEYAITVAATDFNDSTAYFSSKGPTPQAFAIKPDVAAPGVKIYSSLPGNTYANYSGTSMASPHVTGAVALLLEKNPTWTPDIVKSALMGTAVNTHNEMIWHQGAGRIDVRQAIDATFSTAPASISLGRADLSNDKWISTQTLTLKNTASKAATFTLGSEGEEVGNLINIIITPAQVVVPANSSLDINIVFTVSVKTLAPKVYPEPYAGSINVTANGKTVKVPYAFINTSSTDLTFTGELPQRIFVISKTRPTFWKSIDVAPKVSVMLSEDLYDVIAYYLGNYFVIKENLSPSASYTFNKTEANNKIIFKTT
jgi:minor extracellular serine protease Vpr